MKFDTTVAMRSNPYGHAARETPSSVDQAIGFYEAATDDYEHWSRGFNMHLGFYRRGMNPFDREKMLEQMNFEIAARLRIDRTGEPVVIDLGCGVGALSRTIARTYPNAIVKGVTIAPSQVKTGNRLNALEGLQKRIEIIECDFTELPFVDHSADGVWAVESACYARGVAKEDLIRAMARVLKPGGRFAVADCFLKCRPVDLNFLVSRCYQTVCKSWALPEMPVLESFVMAFERHGFRDLVVEDISWNVAPSIAACAGSSAQFHCETDTFQEASGNA